MALSISKSVWLMLHISNPLNRKDHNYLSETQATERQVNLWFTVSRETTLDFKLQSISNTKQIQWFINDQLQVFIFHSFTADEKYWLHSIRKYFEMFPKRPPIILLGVYLSLADSVQRDLQNIYINWWSYNCVECVHNTHRYRHARADLQRWMCKKDFYFVSNLYLHCAWSYSTVVLKHPHRREQL